MRIWNLDGGCLDDSSPVIVDLTTDQAIEVLIPGPPGPAGVSQRAGIVSNITFAGTPKKAAVIFTTAFLDTNFIVILTGQDSRLFTYESKSRFGFTINANSNGALTGEVSWFAVATGQP